MCGRHDFEQSSCIFIAILYKYIAFQTAHRGPVLIATAKHQMVRSEAEHETENIQEEGFLSDDDLIIEGEEEENEELSDEDDEVIVEEVQHMQESTTTAWAQDETEELSDDNDNYLEGVESPDSLIGDDEVAIDLIDTNTQRTTEQEEGNSDHKLPQDEPVHLDSEDDIENLEEEEAETSDHDFHHVLNSDDEHDQNHNTTTAKFELRVPLLVAVDGGEEFLLVPFSGECNYNIKNLPIIFSIEEVNGYSIRDVIGFFRETGFVTEYMGDCDGADLVLEIPELLLRITENDENGLAVTTNDIIAVFDELAEASSNTPDLIPDHLTFKLSFEPNFLAVLHRLREGGMSFAKLLENRGVKANKRRKVI